MVYSVTTPCDVVVTTVTLAVVSVVVHDPKASQEEVGTTVVVIDVEVEDEEEEEEGKEEEEEEEDEIDSVSDNGQYVVYSVTTP